MASEQHEVDTLPMPAPAESTPGDQDQEIRRILKLRVPVIVQLANRPMSIAAIRSLAPGAIIEFDKSVEEALELLINNQQVARGACVRVDENFGLRISAIKDPAQRIRTLGPRA